MKKSQFQPQFLCLETCQLGGAHIEKTYKVEAYEDGTQLSFEFRGAREAGLPYDVAQRIFDVGSGMGPIVYPLIKSNAQSVEQLDQHIEELDCWGDGTTQSIADALADHFI